MQAPFALDQGFVIISDEETYFSCFQIQKDEKGENIAPNLNQTEKVVE